MTSASSEVVRGGGEGTTPATTTSSNQVEQGAEGGTPGIVNRACNGLNSLAAALSPKRKESRENRRSENSSEGARNTNTSGNSRGRVGSLKK